MRLIALLSCSLFLGFSPVCGAEENQEGAPSRQKPGGDRKISFPKYIYESVPDINSSASEFVSTPDRWRQFYTGKWYDPYNQNVLKGDIPIFGSPGHEWFLELGIISDTLVERAKIALPVGGSSTSQPGRLDTIGNGHLSIISQNIVPKFSLIRGNTTYKPPELELRVTPIINFNHFEAEETGIFNINPARGTERGTDQVGFLELFTDVHLADISKRYDFISSRVGIQEFQSDFRGFVFTDSAPGARIFGNWDENRWQYNLAWFSRLDKDTNSGINTFDSRHEDVFVANVYRQDAIFYGHQIQGSVIYREDTAGSHGFHFDKNGVLRRPASIGDERPKNIYSTYIGLNADGHIDRVNTTTSAYYVTGSESHNPIAGRPVDISAGMFAQEFSYDINWIRLRGSLFWASGDEDPFDGKGNGFDSIVDNPNFAGGDLSFWQRSGLPLIAGGEVFLVNRNSFLPNFRAGKEEGQSNYVNPGLRLLNLGVDFEVTPTLKVITNASYLQFDEVAPLQAVRQDGSFDRDIGYDFSAGVLYRPFLNNNVQVRAGASVLLPKDGVKNLYGESELYDFFTNLILEY
jgi:hypothetical protein